MRAGGAWRRAVRLACLLACCAGVHGTAAAQDVPAVFIHGLASQGDAWRDAAQRLEQDLRVQSFRPTLASWEWYERQAQAVHAAYGALPASTVAVGHSNGGLVARQWSKARTLRGIVTLGAPHEGALLAARAMHVVQANQTLFNLTNFLVAVLSGEPNEFTWMWPFLSGHVWFGNALASSTVSAIASAGLVSGAPVIGQMTPGSAYLAQLNGAPNLAREAGAVPQRVGLVFAAREYWRGGIAVATAPERQELVATGTQVAIVFFDAAVAYLRSNYPPFNSNAQYLARVFQEAAFLLRNLDPMWCWAVTDDASCATSHDGVVSTPTQYFPGGTNLGFYGPAHVREVAWSPATLRDIFTRILRVPARASSSPSPAPSPGPGPASLQAGQRLLPDAGLASESGDYALRYQQDGNLVIYRAGGVPTWSSATSGASAGHLEMQGDGNLVIYDGTLRPVWASGTAGFPGAYATLLGDGHLVIYDTTHTPLWWSGGL